MYNLYDMWVKRVDGSRYLAATVSAKSAKEAREMFNPNYGFGFIVLKRK